MNRVRLSLSFPSFSLSLIGVAALGLPFGLPACDDTQPGTSSTVDASPPSPDGGGAPESGAPAAACPAPTGGPTQHGGSVNTETWTAAASPHILPYDTSVYGTLTIEPCAEVLIGAGKSVSLGAGGKIVAKGDATRPIHIGKKDAAPFASVRTTAGASLELAYVTIDGGGDRLNTLADYAGTLDLQGADPTKPTQPTLFVDHVTVKGSASNGIVLRTGAGFAPGSSELTVSGAAEYPVSLWSRAVGTLPSGTYTGNAHDEILLPATGLSEGVQEDATMHDRGVPYHVGNSGSTGTLYVGTGSPDVSVATLTIEPGVVVRMKKGGVIYVESSTGTKAASGALIAAGTTAKPISFTSAEPTPAAGDWLGIWFGQVPSATNKIDYARIDYAGGASASGGAACNVPPPGKMNDAAIRVFGPPSSAFVTNTVIANSAANGIDRGWVGPTTSFLASNTFQGVARCTETYPRSASGPCPSPVPCPTP